MIRLRDRRRERTPRARQSLSSRFLVARIVVGARSFELRSADLEGTRSSHRRLARRQGETFFWEGRYEAAMNEAITMQTRLNVFEDFRPEIPKDFRRSPFVFLANIDPVLQHEVLDQMEKPIFVGADTMNYWISSKQKRTGKTDRAN